MNSATLQIAIEVDDKGSMKIRQLGQDARKAGTDGKQGFDGMKQSADQADGSMTRLGNSAKVVGGAIAAIAASAVMAKVISEANQAVAAYASYEKQMLVLENQITATGRAGQVTGAQLEAMAQRIDKATLESAAGVREAQGVLMSFRNIGTDSMERVLMAASDMAAVMGGDVVSATRSLARALEDPTQGLTMMARSGTTFTEQQKELIKSLHASGREMEAQNEILKVLESQYGGAAAAAGSGLAGAQDNLNRVSNNLRITLGEKLAPAVERNTNALADWIERNDDLIAQGVADVVARIEWAWRGLYDVIVAGQGHFLTFMDIYISGMIQLEYVTKATWEVIKGSFGVALDAMRIMYAEFLEGIANSLPTTQFTLPVPGDTPVQVGFGGYADFLREMAAGAREGATATAELQGKLAALAETRDREMEQHNNIIASMRASSEVSSTAIETQERTATATIATTAATQELGTATVETAKQKAESAKQDEARLKEALRMVQARVDAERKAAQDRERLESTLTDRIKKMTLDELDYKRWALDQEVAEMRRVAGEHQQTQAMISQYHLTALDEIEGANEQTTTFIEERWKQAYDGMQSVLADWLYNWEINLQSMLNLFKRIIAEMVAAWVMSGLARLLTGQGFGGFSLGGVAGSAGSSMLSSAIGGLAGKALIGEGATSALAGKGLLGGAAAYGGAAMSAMKTGVGSAGSWLAGAQAAGAGVNAGTTLALIEGTFGAGAAAAPPVASGGGAALSAAGTPALAAAGAIFGGIAAMRMIQSISSVSREQMTSPLSGISVRPTGVGDSQANISRWPGVLMASIEEMFRTSTLSAESGARIFDPIHERVEAMADQIKGTLEILAVEFGDMTASMAMSLDGSVTSVDRFLDSVLGYDLAMEQSSQVARMAEDVVRGNSGAMDELRGTLMALGLQGNQLDTVMMALIGSASEAMGAVGGMTAAVNQLSNTPLDVSASINVELRGVTSDKFTAGASFSSSLNSSWRDSFSSGALAGHALGGIFDRPTLIPSLSGHLHQVAEAGYPEAIIPLRRPKQMNDMEDKIDAIADRSDDRAILLAMARNTKKTADLLQRFEMIGLPAREARQ